MHVIIHGHSLNAGLFFFFFLFLPSSLVDNGDLRPLAYIEFDGVIPLLLLLHFHGSFSWGTTP